MDEQIDLELEFILSNKPPTPRCEEGEEAGLTLVWTPKGGWRTDAASVRGSSLR